MRRVDKGGGDQGSSIHSKIALGHIHTVPRYADSGVGRSESESGQSRYLIKKMLVPFNRSIYWWGGVLNLDNSSTFRWPSGAGRVAVGWASVPAPDGQRNSLE